VESVEPSRLVLRDVAKTWPGQSVPVIDHVDLDVDPGTLVSIVGSNGAGKTTLVRLVAGLIAPDTGSIIVDGLNVREARRAFQQRIGFLSASHGGLYARLSVRQHLDLWARLAYVPRRRRAAAIDVAIDHFDLQKLLGATRVDRLSMGQRQRLRLAMAFLHEPKLVLLDEPWNSLDEEGHRVLASALAAFVRGGGSAVCCSPTGTEIGSQADATYVVRDGKVIRT
jgi:ABC-type multidrug transport system ATPase subunit